MAINDVHPIEAGLHQYLKPMVPKKGPGLRGRFVLTVDSDLGSRPGSRPRHAGYERRLEEIVRDHKSQRRHL